jgi:hypothetical protein
MVWGLSLGAGAYRAAASSRGSRTRRRWQSSAIDCYPLRRSGRHDPPSEVRRDRERVRGRTLWTAGLNSPQPLLLRDPPGARNCRQAGSPLPRRRLHLPPDGAARAVHRGGTRRRCRSLHAAPLCSACREEAPADRWNALGPPSPLARLKVPNWEIGVTPGKPLRSGGMCRAPTPTASRRTFGRSSRPSEPLGFQVWPGLADMRSTLTVCARPEAVIGTSPPSRTFSPR